MSTQNIPGSQQLSFAEFSESELQEQEYPLTPLQAGMLFHHQLSPESGVYFAQLSGEMSGPLDLTHFQVAWQSVVDRHSALRTRFVWEGRPQPVQIVEPHVQLPLAVEDWRGCSAEQQRQRLQARANDRQSYRLTATPLMSVTLLRLADERYRLVWNFQHLLLDGWSVVRVLEEVFEVYNRRIQGDLSWLPASENQFGAYLEWRAQQDFQQAEQFWRRSLAGLTQPTRLPEDRRSTSLLQAGHYAKRELTLTEAETLELKTFARQARTTIGTLLEGAWALLLAQTTGQRDLLFGVVSLGRPATLAGWQEIVGLMMNTVPVRMQVSPETRLLDWLTQHRREQFELRQFDYCSLTQIHDWCAIPRGVPLVESVIAVQGFLRNSGSLREWAAGLGLSDFEFVEWNNLPLSATFELGPPLTIELKYDTDRFTEATIDRLFATLRKLFHAICGLPEATMGELLSTCDPPGTRQLNSLAMAGATSETTSHENNMRGKAMPEVESNPSGKKIGPAKRRAVGGEMACWVRTGLVQNQPFPLLVEPATDGVDLVEWAGKNRPTIDDWLLQHRALLFRGFGIQNAEQFQRFVLTTSNGQLLEYRDRSTPRTTKGNRIYTSTVHPASERILPHNEGTYWLKWALKIYFCCLKPSGTGGETPLVDVRRVFNRLEPAVRDRFAEKQMMLVRNYNDGFGLSWQEVFQTQDKAEVEQYCHQNRIELEWKSGDRLRTRQIRPAVRIHPQTGEPLWFNHAAFFHYTSLPESTREALLAEFGIEGLPYNTCYGDGTPIEPETAEQVRQAYAAEQVMFPWQAGDLLMLDNMSIAHAREPYTGEREVIVSMTDAVDGDAI